MHQPVIEASTQGIAERGVGGAASAEVGGADQSMHKGREFARRKGNPRSKDRVVQGRTGTILAADIGHDADPRRNLALERSVPAV